MITFNLSSLCLILYNLLSFFFFFFANVQDETSFSLLTTVMFYKWTNLKSSRNSSHILLVVSVNEGEVQAGQATNKQKARKKEKERWREKERER